MPSRMRVLFACGAVALLAGAGAGQASSAVTFATPSLNIGCYGGVMQVRCDIARSAAPRPPRPRACRFDWGTAFGVGRTGRGRGLCASDTVLPDPRRPPRILRYGQRLRVNAAITCVSRRTGLTCANSGGHGFTLSTQRIRLF